MEQASIEEMIRAREQGIATAAAESRMLARKKGLGVRRRKRIRHAAGA